MRMNLAESPDEIAQTVGDLPGYKAISAQLREVVESAISAMV